jgi:hypothetical protein
VREVFHKAKNMMITKYLRIGIMFSREQPVPNREEFEAAIKILAERVPMENRIVALNAHVVVAN